MSVKKEVGVSSFIFNSVVEKMFLIEISDNKKSFSQEKLENVTQNLYRYPLSRQDTVDQID